MLLLFLYPTDIKCFSQPCQNDGKCIEAPNSSSYTCTCPAGFSGTHCEFGKVLNSLHVTIATDFISLKDSISWNLLLFLLNRDLALFLLLFIFQVFNCPECSPRYY